jgi:hypothetical protein
MKPQFVRFAAANGSEFWVNIESINAAHFDQDKLRLLLSGGESIALDLSETDAVRETLKGFALKGVKASIAG